MRILYFTAQDSPHDRRFLRALAGTIHQVFSLRMHPCQPLTPSGITELAWPAEAPDWKSWPGWLAGIAQFLDIIADLEPDLVHAGPVQGPACLTAMAGFHPLATMSWGYDLLRLTERSPWMRFAAGYTLAHSDLLLADCQTVVEKAARYGFEPSKTVRFPWGVDLAHFSPENANKTGSAFRSSLGWENQFVILCNRSWSPPYGVDLLAQAFVRISQQQPDFRLLLAGDGSQSDLIHRILQPVDDKVHFPGWIDFDNLPALYGAANLFVSPSHYDGSSVSLMEALACGCPVLVSDIPSNQEWVQPGEVGAWFTDGDLASLENQLSALAADPKLEAYGKNARVLAEKRADWNENFNKLLDAYQMALS